MVGDVRKSHRNQSANAGNQLSRTESDRRSHGIEWPHDAMLS